MVSITLCQAQQQTHEKQFVNPPSRVRADANLDPCVRKLTSAGPLAAYNVAVPPHGSTLVAPHEHDYLLVTLKKSDLTLSGTRGNVLQLHLGTGEMQVVNGGWAHRVENLDDTAALLVEIDVAGGIRPEHANCGLTASECSDARFGSTDEGTYNRSTLFETPTVKLTRISLGPGGVLQQHGHTGPEILVPLAPVHLANENGLKPAQLDMEVGDVHSFPPGASHQIKNVGAEPAQFLEFERK